MTVHPCEARRYLGQGISEGGGGHDHLCPDAISQRVTFTSAEGERVAVSYLCNGHAAEVVAVVTGEAGTPAGMLQGMLSLPLPGEGRVTVPAAEVVAAGGLAGVTLSPYRPRTAERVEAVAEGVGR